jgi:UDP-N-acetylmuramate dehydrogenase
MDALSAGLVIDGQGVRLASMTSIRVGGNAMGLVEIGSAEDARGMLRSLDPALPVIPIGHGTNLFFGDGEVPAILVLAATSGIRVRSDGAERVLLSAGARVAWDQVVEVAVADGLQGVEYLSGIPGTVGAAPVHNIGALGHDIRGVLHEVRALDLRTGAIRRMRAADCGFGYRRSVFLRNPGRLLILDVVLRLRRSDKCLARSLPNLAPYLTGLPRMAYLREVREAVLASRAARIPDPGAIPNCGSFFINPWLREDAARAMIERWPGLPTVPEGPGRRLRAGWMIERVGGKSLAVGRAGVHERNAMVIVNLGSARFDDICRLARELRSRVRARFGVRLRQEPTAVSGSDLSRWR